MEPFRTDGESGFRLEDLAAEEWFRWYESLDVLDRRKKPGVASARIFAWIWLRCRAEVKETFHCYLPDLAARFGIGVRAVQESFERLEQAELLYVKNRTLKARIPEGWVLMDVYHPNPYRRDPPIRVDPQRRFGFMEEEPAEPAVAAAGSGMGLRGRAGASVRRRPGADVRARRRARKTPGVEAVAKAAGTGEVSMGQAIRLLQELPQTPRARPPPTGSVADIRYRDLNRNRNRNRDLDIGIDTQKKYEELIQQQMADPELHAGPVTKVAAKLAEGLLEWVTVKKAIDRARQLVRDGKVPFPFVYWTRAMEKLFLERGWRWRWRK